MDPVSDRVVVIPELDDMVTMLADEADEGFFHTAAQLYVSYGGEVVLDAAVGRTHLHAPYGVDTLSALYCTGKPLVTLGVLALIDADELSLDDRLGDVIDDLPVGWMADRTVHQVLAHTAGLHVVNTILARVIPERSRAQWLVDLGPDPGWRFGIDRAYAEFGGWFLLGRIIESITGGTYDRFIDEQVLTPYGVPGDELVVRFDDERWATLVGRLSATLDLTLERPVPLLAEVGPQTAVEWNPAFGSYGSMRGIGHLYEGVLADLEGGGAVVTADLLTTATAPNGPPTDDATLGREAGFGLGFMTDLSSHHFGRAPSERAFGHTGQGGTSFGMVDPEHDLVIAVLLNAGLDEDTGLAFRRVRLIDAIYRAIDLAPARTTP